MVLRFGIRASIGFLGLVGAFAATLTSASAREKDAAIVVEAATGKVLYSRSADELRYPASLTKMMTLYLLFEAIEKGEVSLGTRMVASPEAASQKPTRLGLDSGDVLTVEDAIKALIIRSANDAAVVVAEHLSGSEERFAVRMTAKARELGMKSTQFMNASGLPDIYQQSTALDLVVLSRRLIVDFAKYYPYFNMRSFSWNSRTYNGHNNILSRLEGADGLKTGYTRLSGYNLASSATRRGTRLIAIVLGGSSAYWRDVQMVEMLESQYEKMGLGRPPAIVVAMSPLVPDEDEMDGLGSRQVVVESAVESRPAALRAAAFTPSASLSPILPKTSTVPSITPIVPGAITSPIVPNETTPAEIHKNRKGLNRKRAQRPRSRRVSDLMPAYPDAPKYVRLEIKPGFAAPNGSLKFALKPGSAAATAENATRVWGIQVGAFDLKSQAKDHAAKLRGKARDIIGRAKPVVLAVKIAGKTKYRLRFGPFQASLAGDVCRKLVARKFVCGVIQDGNWNKQDSPVPAFASS